MKIAMMVRGYITGPRPSDIIYAPIDLAVQLADGLAELGHEVTFFAPNGSGLKYGKVETLNIRPLVNNQEEFTELLNDGRKMAHYVPGLWDRKFVGEMFASANKGEFDLLHFHHPEAALELAQIYTDIPVVYTMHDPFYEWYRELFELYQSENQHFISISDNQRRDAPDINFADTVYNGIDPELFKYNETSEDYLVIAGRIVPEKGIREAIQVAKQSDDQLFIIGRVAKEDQDYFDQYIKPELNEKILYLGYMEQKQLVKYIQKAKAFLMPIQWEEPFGLAVIESMSCGTPVIAFDRGAMREIIQDGKNGFICHNAEEMVEAVNKVDKINRSYCRKYVEKNFAISNMVKGYENSYKKVLGLNNPSSKSKPKPKISSNNLSLF
jgi:glycosyltransferase involved in cell wall biosynthesis